ncbi:MAG: hypothetical protein PHV77_04630 [Candidatus Omnitrophica bacterium]|nr:hypothetical protein [Candidatus Omnitrophota bacterium]
MKKIFILIPILILVSLWIFYFFNINFNARTDKISLADREQYEHGFVLPNEQSVGPSSSEDTMEAENFSDTPAAPETEEHAVLLPFAPSETLVYDVYCAGVKAGSSVLKFLGEEELDGERVYHMTFETELPFLKDYEDIYAHKGSFLPLKIKRIVHKMGGISTEEIEEEYDQDKFTVTIKKKSAFLSGKDIMQKEGYIHNAILLTYLCRSGEDINMNEYSKVILPTQEFRIRLSGQSEEDTPSGRYIADIFTSEPSKFTFYLSRDSQRLPVKVTSHTSLGYTMTLRSVENRP